MTKWIQFFENGNRAVVSASANIEGPCVQVEVEEGFLVKNKHMRYDFVNKKIIPQEKYKEDTALEDEDGAKIYKVKYRDKK